MDLGVPPRVEDRLATPVLTEVSSIDVCTLSRTLWSEQWVMPTMMLPPITLPFLVTALLACILTNSITEMSQVLNNASQPTLSAS